MKPTFKTLPPTSGWMRDELKMTRELMTAYRMKRSQLFRFLVRNAYAALKAGNAMINVEGGQPVPVAADFKKRQAAK